MWCRAECVPLCAPPPPLHGWWPPSQIAEVPGLSGVLAYGRTRNEAVVRVQALALRRPAVWSSPLAEHDTEACMRVALEQDWIEIDDHVSGRQVDGPAGPPDCPCKPRRHAAEDQHHQVALLALFRSAPAPCTIDPRFIKAGLRLRSPRSDIGQRQGARSLAIEVCEAVLHRKGSGHQHGSGVPHDVGIAGKRCDGASATPRGGMPRQPSDPARPNHHPPTAPQCRWCAYRARSSAIAGSRRHGTSARSPALPRWCA